MRRDEFGLAPREARGRGGLGGRRHGRAEGALGQGQELSLVHRTGHGDDHPVRGIEPGAPGPDTVAGHRGQAGHRTQDGPSQGLTAEGPGLDHLEYMVVGGVEGLGDLLGDDVFLALDLGRVQRRTEHQVSDDLHGQRQGAVQGPNLETGALIAGRGIDRAPLGLDPFDDLARRHVTGPLEHQVFKQVGPARLGLGLPSRPAPHCHRQGQGPQSRHRVTDQPDTVGQGVQRCGQDFSFRRTRAM